MGIHNIWKTLGSTKQKNRLSSEALTNVSSSSKFPLPFLTHNYTTVSILEVSKSFTDSGKTSQWSINSGYKLSSEADLSGKNKEKKRYDSLHMEKSFTVVCSAWTS